MSVSDEFAGRLAAQHAQNEAKPEEATSKDWERCYRLLVMGALNRIPRSNFPEDLAAVGVIVEAAELLPWSLFVSCGNQDMKMFAGDGINDLLQWLDRCYELFMHVAEIHGDLPRGRSGDARERMCRSAAGEIRYLSGQVRAGLEAMHRHDDDQDDNEGSETCAQCEQPMDQDGNPLQPLAVSGKNFAYVAARLYELIYEWLDPGVVNEFNDRVTDGNRDLVHSRVLLLTNGREEPVS